MNNNHQTQNLSPMPIARHIRVNKLSTPLKNKRASFDADNNDGFTLVEILITVGLMLLFTVAAATYNRATDQQIALYREQGKVINKLYEVRGLAISLFNRGEGGDVPCGYGIHIDRNRRGNQLIVYKDIPDIFGEGKCELYASHTSQPTYDGTEEIVETVSLEGISMTLPDGVDSVDILFVPPDPQVYTSTVAFPVSIVLSAPRVATDLIVDINQFGQIVTRQASNE